MRLRLLIVIGLLLAIGTTFAGCGRSRSSSPASGLRIVTIDPRQGFVIRPLILDRKATRGRSFAEIVAPLHAHAVINGTFYDGDLRPLGDVVLDGKIANSGRYPNAIAVRRDGRIEIIRKSGRSRDWSSYECALAAGPRLIDRGKISLHPVADGFTQMMSLDIAAPRSGVGLTKDGKLLLMVSSKAVSLREFALMMKNAGAVEAMNLDGGPACALYHRGKVLVNPTLRMTNLLVVYEGPGRPISVGAKHLQLDAAPTNTPAADASPLQQRAEETMR